MRTRSPLQIVAALRRLALGVAGVGIVALGWVIRSEGTPTDLLVSCAVVAVFFGAAIAAILVKADRIEARFSNEADSEERIAS